MCKQVVILGAGGHGKVIADIVRASGDRVLGFRDDDPHKGKIFAGLPILGRIADAADLPGVWYILAVGNNRTREKLAETLSVRWYTAIHPTAVISPMETAIGEGSVIMANAVVNPGTQIGRHCILNTGASVDHDNRIGDFVHISVGARTAGTVSIGQRTMLGIGAVVSNNSTVVSDCMIGAGAAVVHDITEPGTYVGVPVRKVK